MQDNSRSLEIRELLLQLHKPLSLSVPFALSSLLWCSCCYYLRCYTIAIAMIVTVGTVAVGAVGACGAGGAGGADA